MTKPNAINLVWKSRFSSPSIHSAERRLRTEHWQQLLIHCQQPDPKQITQTAARMPSERLFLCVITKREVLNSNGSKHQADGVFTPAPRPAQTRELIYTPQLDGGAGGGKNRERGHDCLMGLPSPSPREKGGVFWGDKDPVVTQLSGEKSKCRSRDAPAAPGWEWCLPAPQRAQVSPNTSFSWSSLPASGDIRCHLTSPAGPDPALLHAPMPGARESCASHRGPRVPTAALVQAPCTLHLALPRASHNPQALPCPGKRSLPSAGATHIPQHPL